MNVVLSPRNFYQSDVHQTVILFSLLRQKVALPLPWKGKKMFRGVSPTECPYISFLHLKKTVYIESPTNILYLEWYILGYSSSHDCVLFQSLWTKFSILNQTDVCVLSIHFWLKPSTDRQIRIIRKNVNFCRILLK